MFSVTKIGEVKRINNVSFKLLFANSAEIGICDVLGSDIMEQSG